MKRFAFKAVLFSTVSLAVAYVSLYFFVRSVRFQQWLQAEAIHRTGHKIALSDLRLIFPFSLTASTLEVSNESGTLLQGERITVTLGFFDFFSKSVYRIKLQKPIFHIDLQKLFDSSANASIDLGVRHLNVEDGTIVLKITEGQNLDFREVTLNAENINMGQTSGLTLRTDLPWLEGSAEVSIQSNQDQQEAEIKLQQTPAKDFNGFLSQKTPSRDALDVKIKLQKTPSQGLAASASGQVDQLAIGKGKIIGRFESRGDIDPDFKSAALSVKIVARELPSQIGSVKLPAIAGDAIGDLEGTYSFPEKTMSFKSFHLASGSGTANGKGIMSFSPEPTFANTRMNLSKVPVTTIQPFLPEPIRTWTIRGTAEADLELEGPWHAIAIKGVARTNGAEIKSDAFSLQQLNLVAPFQWFNSSLSAGNLQLQGKVLAAAKDGIQFAADELKLDGALELKHDEPLRTSARFRLVRGRYATADGSTMGENLALGGRVEVISRESRRMSLSGSLDCEQGEILWGRFFGDLKQQKASLDFDGDYLGDDDQLELRRLTLSLATLGKVALKGTVQQISQQPALRTQIIANDVRPAGIFETFIRETLHRSYPILDQLIVGGRMDFTAQVHGTLDQLSAEGQLRLRGANLGVTSDEWHVGSIHLVLPFRVQWPAAASQRNAKRVPSGTLSVDSIRFGSESVPAFKTSVVLGDNELRFNEPIRPVIYGGTIEIRNLAWNDLLKNPQGFSLSIEAKDLQLRKLTESLGWYRFGGTLSGSIPKVEMTGNVLRSEGQIQIEVFGGQVQVTKTEIENPFSSLPAIKLDARFQGIHLEQASKTFAFGSISGILEGTLTDVVIINGQPAQLRADVHTVEQPGTSQWISVEALNKITILSSGEDGSLVYGGIASFFDEFRYSKMGFKATLRNDKLTLRGIESRDDKEFLVVGTLLPPTVNVISHTREIGFSDLMKRLEQIQKTDKPEIK